MWKGDGDTCATSTPGCAGWQIIFSQNAIIFFQIKFYCIKIALQHITTAFSKIKLSLHLAIWCIKLHWYAFQPHLFCKHALECIAAFQRIQHAFSTSHQPALQRIKMHSSCRHSFAFLDVKIYINLHCIWHQAVGGASQCNLRTTHLASLWTHYSRIKMHASKCALYSHLRAFCIHLHF